MNRIETACLKDLSSVRGLNTLLKIIDVADFYWNTDTYIRAAITEKRCFVVKDASKDFQIINFARPEGEDNTVRISPTDNAAQINYPEVCMIRGAMIMEYRDPEKQYPKPSLAIGTLSVRPEFRRNGIGIQLVEYAKAMARQKKKRLYVESFLEFRQLSFYKRLGFQETLRKIYQGKTYHVLFVDP